jgi:Asp-tRNA(Asn)/Glu-tRNA(Gln) amidotransferase A subunit family amidase
MANLQNLSATEAARLIAEKNLSPVALLDDCLAQIARHDGDIAAWIHVDEKGARATARDCEREADDHRLRGPLHGVPVAIKDIIDVAGMTTTYGAKPFAHRRADKDAACVARLRAAGAVILGKVATTEFAYFEPAATRNPWNSAHTPGGSSSGSAAAVAARMVPLALGTQTVGSVVRPAAFCGIAGYKGTFGVVPVEGSSALARSFDHIGIFARKIADARLAFAILSGRALGHAGAAPPRLALAPELIARAEPDVAAQIGLAVARLAAAGAEVTEITLPASFAAIHAAGSTILAGEFATYQEDFFRDHAADYRPRTRELVAAGRAQAATDYVKAQQARAQFRDDMMPILRSAGVLLCPAAAGTAPAGLASTGDPWFCAPWTAIGVPAVALPTAIGAAGMPHAIQLVGSYDGDAQLLAAADWCEGVLAFDLAPSRLGVPGKP